MATRVVATIGGTWKGEEKFLRPCCSAVGSDINRGMSSQVKGRIGVRLQLGNCKLGNCSLTALDIAEIAVWELQSDCFIEADLLGNQPA